MSKWPHIAYRKKLPFFFYNLQKIACRYLQNYAHRKKSKTYHQKETPCICISPAGNLKSFEIFTTSICIRLSKLHVSLSAG